MVSRISQWTLDVHDVDTMAAFWSQVLGYEIEMGDDGTAKLYPPKWENVLHDIPPVWLQASADPKRDKNRNHPDLRVSNGSVEGEVERLIALGARHVDVGQTDHDPFVVLADPEGNEFCLLRNPPRRR